MRRQRARRQAERPQPRVRRPRRALLGALLVLVVAAPASAGLAWLGARAADPESFPISGVRVYGELRYQSREELQEIVRPHLGGGFFRVRVEALRRELEALPWVRGAMVRRSWPDRVEIAVEEQVALGAWAAGGLVSLTGEYFAAPPGTGPEGLPEFAGPEGQSARVVAQYRTLGALLRPLKEDIRRLELDGRGAWSLVLGSGLRLELGREQVEARLRRFVAAYAGALGSSPRRPARVDLRYANGFAVEFRDSGENGPDGAPRGELRMGEAADAEKA